MGYVNTVDQFMMIANMTFTVNDDEGNYNKLTCIFLQFKD